jgi:hypothetical protein
MAAIADLRSGTSKKRTALSFEGYDSAPFRSRQTNPAPLSNLVSMVLDLLIGNFKTHRFDVELLGSLQIFEVEFNTDESRSNPLHKILSRFDIVPQQFRSSLLSRGTCRAIILKQL